MFVYVYINPSEFSSFQVVIGCFYTYFSCAFLVQAHTAFLDKQALKVLLHFYFSWFGIRGRQQWIRKYAI